MNGRAAQLVPSQESQVTAEIIALQFFPGGRLLPLFLVPLMEFEQGLAIIALRVIRRAAVCREVGEKSLDPSIADFGMCISHGFGER